jgi:TonB family protein
VQGTVVVRWEVARDGTVSGLEVVSSSGIPELDLAALAAVPARLPPLADGARSMPMKYTFRTRK